MGKHVASLRHINLILCSGLSGEAANTICMVFCMTRPGLEPTIYRTRGNHDDHYTTDAVVESEELYTRCWVEKRIYRTRGDHARHCASDAVPVIEMNSCKDKTEIKQWKTLKYAKNKG